jgi:predicted amidohydrolase
LKRGEVRVAAVQLNSNGEKARNLAAAERLVRAAAADGAELVALPEKWNLLASGEELTAGAEALDGPSLAAARSWARELGIHLLAGSIAERGADRAGERDAESDEKAFNTSVLIGPDGEDLAIYRKIHMFDVEAGGVVYRESEYERAGEEIVSAPVDGLELGLTVCYDLRFPELHRILAVRGAHLIAVPSAFTAATGRDHWEVLLRARAIENQVFVIAPDQVGEAPPHYSSYGHSAIVDPWGAVLAIAPDEECFVAADLDLAAQERTREQLPSLANRRPQAYRWPQLLEAHA